MSATLNYRRAAIGKRRRVKTKHQNPANRAEKVVAQFKKVLLLYFSKVAMQYPSKNINKA